MHTIEDSLQEGVPQAIERLALAGIKIWVLTGDKHEPIAFDRSNKFTDLLEFLGCTPSRSCKRACPRPLSASRWQASRSGS